MRERIQGQKAACASQSREPLCDAQTVFYYPLLTYERSICQKTGQIQLKKGKNYFAVVDKMIVRKRGENMEKELQILEPMQCKLEDFPVSEEIPEGCIVIDDLVDEGRYKVDLHKVTYVMRRDEVGKEKDLCMYIYEPKIIKKPGQEDVSQKLFPVIIYCQGSAFHKQWLFDRISNHIRMAERGYIVAVFEYRPSDDAPFPAQMEDCKTAVRYMRKHAEIYHCDVNRFALWGNSSGGHVALTAGFTGDDAPDTDVYKEAYSAKVSCIVDWFAPTDFALMNCYPTIQNHFAPDSPEGCEIGHKNVLEHPELNAYASPMTYLSKDKPTPPTLIMHGGHDVLVPFNQSCRLYNRLKELGRDATLIKLTHGNHGWQGFESDKVLDIVEEFLAKHM